MALLPGRTFHLSNAAGAICCMGALIFYIAGFGLPAPALAAPDLSAEEKQKLVQQAVAHYEQKETAKAQEGLERARTAFSDNYAAPYYLGLIYLEQGNRKGAIAQWQQYVKMAPHSDNTHKIHKHLTLLLREQAREDAKLAVAREAALPAGPADDGSIAVMSFRNLGSENLGPLGKGMAAMLISDLSLIPDLQVVDRIKLHALLEEMELGVSGLVDSRTAPRLGKLLRARHVTSGSLADLEKEKLIIASSVVDTDRKTSIGAQEAKGVLQQFYELEKKIACQIIEDLGWQCDAAPGGFHKIHTKSMPALVAYSWGLTHFDEENYDQARESFQKALEEDPQFDLAEEMLMVTPMAAMLAMGTSDVIASISSSGPSSTAAGTAVAGTATTGTAASVAAGAAGLPPMTTIIGGVALVGGGVALAGGGGGGGGGSSEPITQPADQADLNGDWRGTWTDAGGDGGEAVFSLTQTGDAVTGTISVIGDDCLSTGNVTGNVSGNIANLSIQSGAETVAINAAVDNSTHSLSGTWNYSDSALGCAGETGNVTADLTTGEADIRW